MINTKGLIEMLKKWRSVAASGRRRISWATTLEGDEDLDLCSITSAASKGKFVVYSIDGKRFAVPLEFVNSKIIRELFKISEEEFGLPCDGPITVPCDAVFMEYVVSLLPRRVSKDVERALLISIASTRCSASSSQPQGHPCQQLLVHGF